MSATLPIPRPVDFNRDIRPILSDKCFSCHGPDAVAKKIPLRLDSEAAAKADLGGRRAIVEGDPDASTVVKRITAEKPAMRMPPVYSGLKLTELEIQTIQEWIRQGAKWQKHWAFIPPVRRPLPAVSDAGWAKTPIDNFVLQHLDGAGLKPSPEASREALIRRVSLDLTGLPPTVAEVDAFLADKSPNAYEKVVDRLLASPRYGERMAVRWLDAARYADTNGYQFDGERNHVALARLGDRRVQPQPAVRSVHDRTDRRRPAAERHDSSRRSRPASTATTAPTPKTASSPKNTRSSMSSTASRPPRPCFSALTLGCARCHNHKYDPFTQKEFYQIFAYFNNVPELGRAMKYGNSPPVVAGSDAMSSSSNCTRCCSACSANAGVTERALVRSSRRRNPGKRPCQSRRRHTGLLRADWSTLRPLTNLRRTNVKLRRSKVESAEPLRSTAKLS